MKDNVVLRTENMSRKYVISDRRETEIEVIKDINLEIREQEFISIMGIRIPGLLSAGFIVCV